MGKNNMLSNRPLDIELGCGNSKRSSKSIGVDNRALPGVDIVGDALEVLRSLPTDSLRSITSFHFVEHIDYLEELLIESARVLTRDGVFRATAPHFSNPYYYSDPTHRRFFGLYTLSYYVNDTVLRRRVSHYSDSPIPLTISNVRLRFMSTPPFHGRRLFKRLAGALFTVNHWALEFYEENLCWLVPCYEVEWELRPDGRN
jgi:hypothetical protein